jgi:hypothetical protein
MKRSVNYLFSALSLVISISQAGNPNLNKEKTGNVSFTENKGQVHDQYNNPRPDVLFGGTDGSLIFHIRNNGISYQLQRVDKLKTFKIHNPIKNVIEDVQVPAQTSIQRLDIDWLNANEAIQISYGNTYEGYANFYMENCPKGVRNVRTYKDVTLNNIYDGISLKWYQKDGHLKYDYYVAPRADYTNIKLEIKGALEINLDNQGGLIIKTALGMIAEAAPLVLQNKKQLPAKWLINKVSDGTIFLSFEIKDIDPLQAFTIDPIVRTWGTYYGGTGDENGVCMPDNSGNVYVSGSTNSTTGTIIATAGSTQDTYFGGYMDAFLAKFNSAGQRQWATYFGGSGDDYGGGVAVDKSNFVYLSGSTSSGGSIMATAGSHQPSSGGAQDDFLARFDGAGNLYWSTYYGGVGTEYGGSCVTDQTGSYIYLIGSSGSTSGIATAGCHQGSKGSASFGGFLAKFNIAGVRQWGTYYCGSGGSYANGGAVDKQGNVYLTGETGLATGTTIATPGTHQPTGSGGTGPDAFLAKFNSAGVRQWGTFYGGSNDDRPGKPFFDSIGNVYLAGISKSTNGISTSGAYQTNNAGLEDGFVVKFNPSGQRLWGTYYGGVNTEFMSARLDKDENILLFGTTSSSTGISIATPGSYKPTYGGGSGDMFIAKLTPDGEKRIWGTYYGGSGYDAGGGELDKFGNLYISGYTTSSAGTNIATPGSHQPNFGGGTDGDAFLVKFSYCSPPIPVNLNTQDELSACEGETATLMASASGTLSWYTNSTGGTSIGTGSAFVTPTLSPGSYTYYAEAETCAPGELRTAFTLTVDACTGLSSIKFAEGFKLYPNPNKGYFVIESATEGEIVVTNVIGQVVHNQKHSGGISEIDLNHVTHGVYLVRFTGIQHTYNVKILKE